MENDEEFREIMKKLEQFPNYFQMGAESTNLNRWEKVMQKLNDEKEDFEDMSMMDRFRNLNLFGCIQYYLKNWEAAESTILEVFKESDSTNINACAMMVKIYYIQCKIAQSKKMLQILHELAKDPYKIDIAKGELCYAWSRIDPQYYKKGIDELQNLVDKYFDKPVYSIWAFGLALLYRRCLHLSVKSLHPDLDINHCFKSAKELLENNIQRDDIEPIYKARSYIELANLLALNHIYPDIKIYSNEEIYRLIMEGVALAPECASILMKAGKIMKYIREYSISEAYLEKANKLRPNSFNCHQLALIKQSNIIHAKYNQSNNNRPNQHAGSSQKDNSPQSSYRNIQKRQGQGSYKWQDNVRNKPTFSNVTTQATLSPKNTLHQQPRRDTAVKQLLKSEASSSKVQFDQQTEPTCSSNNPDLEEDSAIQERCAPFAQSCGSHLLEDKLVLDFKTMALDDQNTTTKKFDSDIVETHVPNKDLSTTIASEGIMNSETVQKEAKPNYRSCPKQSVHASKSLDQPGKLSPHAAKFVPRQVQRQMTPQKPNSIRNVIKSPKLRCIDYHKSRQLRSCLQLFEKSVNYSKGTNYSAYYDWGLTLLHMTPSNYKEALQKFNHVIQHCKSMDVRYKAYEQAGICLMKMSEDEKDKERKYHSKNAYEMFKKAIQSWAYCQRMKIHEYFDDAQQNCDSLCSLREMIVGDDSKHDTQKRKDVADMYYLIRQYGPSLELYEELYSKLQQQDKQDIEVIQGIITNRIEIQQFNGVIDLLLIYMNSKEGVCCPEFKFEVLKKTMGYAIVNKDYILAKSVVELVEDVNFTYNVMILYNENDPSSKEVGKCLGGWLGDIGLKVTHNIDDILYGQNKLKGQGTIIGSSKMAICIINNTCKCPQFHHIMHMTLEGFNDGGRKIFLLLINDSKRADLPGPFKPLDSLCVPDDSQIDQQRANILNAFCDIYLAPKN